MKEQSHKQEMAAAIRGDFARLRRRGIVATIGSREPEASPVSDRQPHEEASEAVETPHQPIPDGTRSRARRLFGRR